MEPKTIPALVTFPYPWPPSNPVMLQAVGTPHFTLHVYGLTDSHIKVLIKYPDSKERDFEYQKVAISNAGRVIMILVLEEDKVNLYLNGEPLLLRQEAKGAVKHVNVAKLPAKRALHLDLPDEHAVDNDDEWHFILSLGDLAHKISTGDKYEILQATLPLRKLLLDEQPLVHIVNRSYKKQLRFKVLPLFHDISHKFIFIWQTIDPTLIPTAPTVEVNLKEFLLTTCLMIKDDSYSVRDVITTIAYAKHALHTRGPETQKQRELVRFDKEYKLFDQEPSVAAMEGIVTVVLNALKPLVDAIKEKLKSQSQELKHDLSL